MASLDTNLNNFSYKKCEEERSFWEKLKDDFFEIISMIDKLLRLHHVSYQGISDSVVSGPKQAHICC
jgi:hypothetical protein